MSSFKKKSREPRPTPGLDPTSPAAVFLRNYDFDLQEIADLGAMMLFFEAGIFERVLTSWTLCSVGKQACVEIEGEVSGAFSAEDFIGAMKLASKRITDHLREGFARA